MIFASHRLPVLPPGPIPTVRVLRLASPLSVEDAGAVRLVSTLEWAERVARFWRAFGSSSLGAVCYEEAKKDIPIPVPGLSPGFVGIPLSSPESRSFISRKGLPIIAKARRVNSLPGYISTGSLPPTDPLQRPFDAILNYPPRDVAEKDVLKQAILVATITKPFLAPTLSPYHKLSGTKGSTKRTSNSRAYSLPPTPPYQPGDYPSSPPSSLATTPVPSPFDVSLPHSHLIHVVPPTTHASLIRSLDLFLSSFSRQPAGPEEVNHTKQYALTSSTMRQSIVHPHSDQAKYTVLDLVLLGCLDSVPGNAWIGSNQDLLFPKISAVPSPPVPSKPVRSPSRTTLALHRPVNPVSHPRTREKSPPKLPPFHGGRRARLRRSRRRVIRRSQSISERRSRAPLNLLSHLDTFRLPYVRGPHPPPSLDTPSQRTTQRSKPESKAKHRSGLPTPPDSDSDAWHSPPPSRPIASKLPVPQGTISRWKFWRS